MLGNLSTHFNAFDPFFATGNPWQAYRNQVNRYDQAASDRKDGDKIDHFVASPSLAPPQTDSFLHQVYTRTRFRGFRDLTEVVGNDLLAAQPKNSFVHTTFQPICKKVANPFKVLTQDAVSQAQVLGIKTMPVKLDTISSENYQNIWQFLNDPQVHQLKTGEWLSGWNVIKTKIKSNFRNLFKVKSSLNPLSFFNKVVVGDNVSAFAQQLELGNLVNAGLRGFGMVTALLSIGSNTWTGYENAEAKNGNSLWGNIKTAFETAATFITQSLKTTFIFEAGTIGHAVGKGLVPLIIDTAGVAIPQLKIIRFVSSALGAGIFGALAYKLSSAFIADPEPIKNQSK